MNPSDREKILGWFDLKTARGTAVLSGIFSAIVLGGLLWNGLMYRPMEYFDEESFLAIKESLVENAENPELVEAFRSEDLIRRQNYFASREKLKTGGWLLFGGLFVFALSLRRIAVLKATDPQPLSLQVLENPVDRRPRTLAALLTLIVPTLVVTFAAFAYVRTHPSEAVVGEDGRLVAIVTEPGAPSIPDDLIWPGLRGPGGLGVVRSDAEFPVSWNAEEGTNILWKTPVPSKGFSSPIVWDDKIFLTGADIDHRKVFCFNRLNGSLLWECTIQSDLVLDEEMKKKERMTDAAFAAPTPATNGKYVFAFFGTNEMAAVDCEGNQVWSRWFGKPKSDFGISTSPLCHGDNVLIQLDQSDDEGNDSFLYCIDGATGKNVWRVEREVPASWTSPILAGTGDRLELITIANPWMISYQPETGREYWRAKILDGDVAPLPTYGDGMVFAAVEYSKLSAVRSGGGGDVTDSHLAWTYEDDLPDCPSPITDGNRLILPTSYGTVTCFNAKTGEVLWSESLDGQFWSSPILSGDKVYWVDREGTTHIFRLADTFEALGTESLNEAVGATPAFADTKIYIRGEENLYCIGAAP